MRRHPCFAPVAFAFALVTVAPAFGAGPDATTAGIALRRNAAPERFLTVDELASFPAVRVTVPGEPGHGPQRSFEGPLLWTVLDRFGMIETAKFHDHVRQTVLVTGQDGYKAILALGEISPEFENKQVIVAARMDGQPLSPAHLRLVVPGDKHGGRGVHDVSSIAVLSDP